MLDAYNQTIAGNPTNPYSLTSGAYGFLPTGQSQWQLLQGQAPAGLQSAGWRSFNNQLAPGFYGAPDYAAGQGWADPSSTGVGNPFAADNPYGVGTAYTNFFESHPGLAGVSNFQDIRQQAPQIAAGGQFSNPYGQMRSWQPGASYTKPTSGGIV